VKNPNLTKRHLFADKMDVDLDVLRTTMLNRVAGHVDSADIITKDDGCGTERAMKLVKKLTKPTTLSHSVSDSTILGRSTGARNCSLALGGPGHKIVTEIYTVARSRPASVGTAGPVSIRVRGERCSRCRMQPKTKIQCTLEVSQNSLDQVEMRLTRSMHVEARLLNSMCNVGTRQCQVLKGASKAAVLSRIGNERTIIGGELATSVYGSSTRVAIKHASSV
jgi:hypothetical protein